jgi:hypothetical protein
VENMETNKFIEQFSDGIVIEKSVRISGRKESRNNTTINLVGEGGEIEIVFRSDGDIYATLENDYLFHQWPIFPNSQDISASVKKIGNMIGRDR